MSEKKPDTPVVHLPWSHWQDITARLEALEAWRTEMTKAASDIRALLAPAPAAERGRDA